VYLQMGKTPTIVLGSAQAAWDLLEKRSNIYSSRPRFIMAGELLSNNMRGVLAGYNDYWRAFRKSYHLGFMQKAAENYKPVQLLESTQLLMDLMNTPTRFEKHLQRYAASTIVSVAYGRRVKDMDTDPVVRANTESTDFLVSVNVPGKYMVEVLPWLKYIPTLLAPFKKLAYAQRERDKELYHGLVNEVRRKMAAGIATDTFTRTLIENQAKMGLSDDQLAYFCGSPFSAGVETSAGSLITFVLACCAFGPNFIPKAQEELDRVVGSERLPNFDDKEDLPYIQAIVGETLRWRPIAIIGGQPHASIAEDVYNGMYIPKGSTVIANLSAIHSNEKDFPESDIFRPERFLDKERMARYPGQFGHSAFGFGRRICPGMWLGQNSVWLNIARMMWAFNFSKAKDASGREIPVDYSPENFTSGFNSKPKEFQASITLRDEGRRRVIMEAFNNVKEELAVFDRVA